MQGATRRWKRNAGLSVALALLAGCDDPTPCAQGWKPALQRAALSRPVLAVWGNDAEDWLVGGPVGAAGLTTLVLRHTGDGWHELPQTGSETLWWVWGLPDASQVWMVGEHGLVLRWRNGSLESLPSGTDATLFGVWGSSADDVWLVGGIPGAGVSPKNDVVLHWDGAHFTSTDHPAAKGAAFFKTWGSGANDLWVVGENGTAWRRTAAGWEDHAAELGTRASVTTVHGCSATEVYAVAGQSVYKFAGATWALVPEAIALAGANGVSCGPAGVLVVGNGGLKLRYARAAGTWTDDTLEEPFYADFHGAFVAATGAMWAVGGNYNAPATTGRVGMVGFDGCPVPR
jgi:hypothetical protein